MEKSFQIVNPFLFLQAMYYCISLWLVKDGLIYEDISKWKSVFKFAMQMYPVWGTHTTYCWNIKLQKRTRMGLNGFHIR